MLQHRWRNIDGSTSITTSNAPNRQKPQKSLTAKNPKNPQKFPTAKNSRPPKISAPQKNPDKNSRQTKNPTQNGTLRKTLRLDQPELFYITDQLP
jgi:hypothetical protein